MLYQKYLVVSCKLKMVLAIPCERCGLTEFNSRKEFNNHLASHQSDFICKEPHCNKTFLTRDKMRYHKRTAHASPVNCQCCDKQFKTEKLLRNHVKENKENNVFKDGIGV